MTEITKTDKIAEMLRRYCTAFMLYVINSLTDCFTLVRFIDENHGFPIRFHSPMYL